jgi:hypothetical protein
VRLELDHEDIVTVHRGPRRSTTQIDRQERVRINVSRNASGGYAWECTVEGVGFTPSQILERSDKLVALLRNRYPSKEERT